MRELYRGFQSKGALEVDKLNDPWHEASYADVFHLAEALEEKKLIQEENKLLKSSKIHVANKVLATWRSDTLDSVCRPVFKAWAQEVSAAKYFPRAGGEGNRNVAELGRRWCNSRSSSNARPEDSAWVEVPVLPQDASEARELREELKRLHAETKEQLRMYAESDRKDVINLQAENAKLKWQVSSTTTAGLQSGSPRDVVRDVATQRPDNVDVNKYTQLLDRFERVLNNMWRPLPAATEPSSPSTVPAVPVTRQISSFSPMSSPRSTSPITERPVTRQISSIGLSSPRTSSPRVERPTVPVMRQISSISATSSPRATLYPAHSWTVVHAPVPVNQVRPMWGPSLQPAHQ